MALSRTEKRETLFLFFIVASLAALVIWIRTATVKDTYHFVEQERELRRLTEFIQSERVHWLKITAPRQLESIGRRLGLASPRLDQKIQFEPHG